MAGQHVLFLFNIRVGGQEIVHAELVFEEANMEYIHSGWALIADGDRILFHDSCEEGDKNDYYTYDGVLRQITEQNVGNTETLSE